MANATPTNVLNQQIAKLNQQVEVLQKRFDQLSGRFCLYWIDDFKAPAVGLILEKYSGKDPLTLETTTLADIFIITRHLGKADITLKKPLVLSDPEQKKQGRWEPMILPQEAFAIANADLLEIEKEPSNDGNGALS